MTIADSAENKNLSNEGAFVLYGLLFVGGIVLTSFTLLNMWLGRTNLPEVMRINSDISPSLYSWILIAESGLTGFLGFVTVMFSRLIKKDHS